MKRNILVLNADKNECQGLCAMLEDHGMDVTPLHSWGKLETVVSIDSSYLVVVIDIDSIPVGNQQIRLLTKKNPGMYLLFLSKDRLHPELQDAICHCVYACVGKPLEREELLYWISSIYEKEARKGNPECVHRQLS